MKNFYFDVMDGTLQDNFEVEEYIPHSAAIDELSEDIAMSPDEVQELVEKIEKVSRKQTEKADKYVGQGFSLFSAMLFAALIASFVFMFCLEANIGSQMSFIAATITVLLGEAIGWFLYRTAAKLDRERAINRGAFAEKALNTLLAKRQQTNFFTDNGKVFTEKPVFEESFDLSLIGFGKGNFKPEPRPLPEFDDLKVGKRNINSDLSLSPIASV